MMFLLVLVILQGALCVPPPTPDQIGDFRPVVGDIDPSFGAHIRFRPSKNATRLVDHNFRYVYVDQEGNQFPVSGDDLLEVSFTETVNQQTLDIALKVVWLQCANTPYMVWRTLCVNGAVGIFTMAEGTTIFPEYEMHRDTPQCRNRCDNECAITCTGDGRKYDSLAGLGGSRATCVSDNILCNRDDPYSGQTNILIHEFTHTIHGYGLDYETKRRIDSAFYAARAAATWDLDAYSMSTSYEYFAEASGVFFFANNYLAANGGMSDCFGKGYCNDQEDGRNWLNHKDPELFDLLSFTFTNYRPELDGGLAQCVQV